jgi:rod shape determining protein RodA
MVRYFKNFNYLMFASMLALIAIGTVAIWSAGNARSEAVFHGMWKQTLATAMLGLVVYLALSIADYRKILEYGSVAAYGTALVLLVAVLVFGAKIYGGRRWLWFFQPSELSKLCIIMFVANFGRRFREFGFLGFVLTGIAVGVPLLLILAEPDLGTALTLVPAVLIMMFSLRIWRKGLFVILAVIALCGSAVMAAVYEAEKPGVTEERRAAILKWVPLKAHQVKRVKVFLFPEEDILGAGYNLRQAKISIGSGGFSGKGIGKGETNHLKYLPQAISMNDFIFCVYAEETGFIGSLALLALFGMLVVPGAWTAFTSNDERGEALALSVSMLVFAHVYVNIAMSIGLVPITGLPLPFISSGRTFLLTVMAALGMVQSVATHREVGK